MINETSAYPAQTFLAPAQAQIIAQIDGVNTTHVRSISFPKTYTRLSSAGTAPDGSGATMYQVDAIIGLPAQYSYQSRQDAQSMVLEKAASTGNEYYIEISPLPVGSYSILTWAAI